MDEIELKVHDMSSTLQPADAYALVLEEVNGNRKLPIIIGSLEAQAIKVVMMGYKMPRPLTHDLFLTVTKELGTALKKVLIYKVKDGVYYSYLFLEKEGEVFKIDSRTSDAIALAMRCGCPVYTTDEIILCINVHGDLWVLYYRAEPSRVKADESGRADLLRVTIHRAVLLDLGRGTGEDGNHHETPVLAGYVAVGHIEYDRFCPVAGGSREIDRFRTEFRVGNVGTDNGNRRGSTLFQ